MFDIPNLHIKVESPRSEDVMDLIRSASPNDTEPVEELIAPNAELLVARVSGTPVGCIALLDHVRFGEAKRLYVDPEARGNGIGAALVAALESAARDIGLRVLTVSPSEYGHLSRDSMMQCGFYAADAKPSYRYGMLEKRL